MADELRKIFSISLHTHTHTQTFRAREYINELHIVKKAGMKNTQSFSFLREHRSHLRNISDMVINKFTHYTGNKKTSLIHTDIYINSQPPTTRLQHYDGWRTFISPFHLYTSVFLPQFSHFSLVSHILM